MSRYQRGKNQTKPETCEWQWHSWAICKSAPHSRKITTPAPHHSVFYRLDALLLPNQQHQSTKGSLKLQLKINAVMTTITLLVVVSILSSLSPSSVRNSRFGYGMGPFSKMLHSRRNQLVKQVLKLLYHCTHPTCM